MINIILAVDKNFGIGNNNKLPWYITDELKIFKQKTLNSIVIVGRKTFESLPPLNDRIIFCITSQSCFKPCDNVYFFKSLDEALEKAYIFDKQIYVIGGNKIYNTIFSDKKYSTKLILHISFIKNIYDCDTVFNKSNLDNYYIYKCNNYENFSHCELIYMPYGEYQYLNLVKHVLSHGQLRDTRNDKTISSFGHNMKFDLRHGFPLLTTKKMYLLAIIEELLFFMRGDTNSKILEEKGINIWSYNTNREFLDKHGFFSRKEGLLGPMYGYQLRYFNADYDENTGKPLNEGLDQLKKIINEIKTNPSSRRLLLTNYNPIQTNIGVLACCHDIINQFYVEDKYLDLFCYNRSSDLFLGLPFNIPSSALFLMIIAKICDLTPRFVYISIGDAHLYKEHVDAAQKIITRIPYIFPNLEIPEINDIEDIEKLSYKDFKITNYNYYPTIKAKMIA